MKRLALLLLSFVILVTFASCGGTQDDGAGEYYTFVDSVGREVKLDSKPERVAVIFSSYADIWSLAGGTVDVTVGEAVERGFATSDAVLVDAGAGHTAIDLETLVASSVDLVIATADYAVQRSACEALSDFGIPAAAFSLESFEDYLSILKIFTDILGTPERYLQYGERVAAEICEIKKTTHTFAGENMLFIRCGTSERSVKAKRGEDHFACAMVEELGLENIADEATVLLDGLSLEAVLSADPCYIFVTFMGDETAARAYLSELLSRDGWSALRAVEEGRVILLPKDLFHYKPNAAWADAYRFIINEIKSKSEVNVG